MIKIENAFENYQYKHKYSMIKPIDKPIKGKSFKEIFEECKQGKVEKYVK